MSATRGKKVQKPRSRCSGRQRMKMRQWLETLLRSNCQPGIQWKDKKEGMFSIAWKHASGRSFKTEQDSDLFKSYAIHTGKYKDGDKPDHKRWKANFRCALHSLDDVEEVTTESYKKGEKAVRVYQFLDKPKAGSKSKRRDSEDRNATENLKMIYEDSPEDRQEERVVRSEVKMEAPSPSCPIQLAPSPLQSRSDDDTDAEHSYSKNDQDAIPKLHTFNSPSLCTGGSVQYSSGPGNQRPAAITININLTPYVKSEPHGYAGCSTPDSEMTDEELVEMVDSMTREDPSDSGYSDSNSSGSPIREITTWWDTDLGLEGSHRARVVTEPVQSYPFTADPLATLEAL